MNSGRTIFAQLMDLLPLAEFRRCVDRYHGDYKVQSFSCLDQFLSLAFAQLTYRESLRDIETCLRAHQSQLYHMGFRGAVSRNTLANANQQRDWRIYADFARLLIAQARGPCGLNNCTWILRANTKSCPLLVVSVQPSASEETGLGTRGWGDFGFQISAVPMLSSEIPVSASRAVSCA